MKTYLTEEQIRELIEDIGLGEDNVVTVPDIHQISQPVDEDGNQIAEPVAGTENFNVKMGAVPVANPHNAIPRVPIRITPHDADGLLYEAFIVGPIREAKDYVDLIDSLKIAKPTDIFHIYLDSPGGLVSTGGIIASAIHHSRAAVCTFAMGICASAAALIHSAASPGNAYVSEYAVMMYHMSSHFDSGTSTKILERAKHQVRYVNECLLNKALEDGHFTREEFAKIQNGTEIFIPAAEFRHRTGGQQ